MIAQNGNGVTMMNDDKILDAIIKWVFRTEWIIFLILVILKSARLIDWSWSVVLIPMFAVCAEFMILLFIALATKEEKYDRP